MKLPDGSDEKIVTARDGVVNASFDAIPEGVRGGASDAAGLIDLMLNERGAVGLIDLTMDEAVSIQAP